MSTVVRPVGRPRSETADRAIVDATLALLADVGVNGLSVEEVAARAGVSKATIYRRFAGRDELISEAMTACSESIAAGPPDTGAVRADLVALLSVWRANHGTSTPGRLMPRILGSARTNPDLFATFWDRVVEPKRENFRIALRRGVERGEVRADVDLELAVTTLMAPTMYALIVADGGRDAAPDATVEDYVDLVLRGLAPA